MVRRSSLLTWIALGFAVGLGGCQRPVAGRSGSPVVTDVRVEPRYVRADTPFEVTFVVVGSTADDIRTQISPLPEESCTPKLGSDGRLRCLLPGLAAGSISGGTAVIEVRVLDSQGRLGVGEAQFIVDFDCPAFAKLSVEPNRAAPGDQVIVTIEANEPLGSPPKISRLGRDWGTPGGTGRSWTLSYEVSLFDASSGGGVTVTLTDIAGNSTKDCGTNGVVPFTVDHTPPVVQPSLVRLQRGIPGDPSFLEAMPGAFIDDVSVAVVRVLDATGGVLASVTPLADGSLPRTAVPAASSRIRLQAVDGFDREGEAHSIAETWALSVGAGVTANAAVRTAIRYTPADPESRFMEDRTTELAVDIKNQDARRAVVRADVGFETVGRLPSRMTNVHQIMSGYEPVSRSIIAAGGRKLGEPARSTYVDESFVLRWDDSLREYLVTPGPRFDYAEEPQAPLARAGTALAADGRGCLTMFGGFGRYFDDNDPDNEFARKDVWQICDTPTGYVWRQLVADNPMDGPYERWAPIAYDPSHDRYVVYGGRTYFGFYLGTGLDDLYYLIRDPISDRWQWYPELNLPSDFRGRQNHLLFFDPRNGAMNFLFGMNGDNPIYTRMWSSKDGSWTFSRTPVELANWQGYGADFDSARGQLVVWGGVSAYDYIAPDGVIGGGSVIAESGPLVWMMTQTATNGPTAWASADLERPIERMWPSLVYDKDREVSVVFGGVRYHDQLTVPPEIHQIIVSPSFPYLQASLDPDAVPTGVERLRVQLRAIGVGDADGTGPEAGQGGGFKAMLYDHVARRWVELGRTTSASITTLDLEIEDRPERFISATGVLPVTVTSVHPGTEAVQGRIEVDRIYAEIDLRPEL